MIHEWGHFYAARRLGVRVEEFGFGFPPRIFSRIKKGVRYSLNLLPFGGFVKIFGEHGEGEGERASFTSRPAWQRFVILAAGVGMNFVLAWLLFSFGAAIGVPAAEDEKNSAAPVSIIDIASNSPAAAAGLRFGDEIIELRAPEVTLRIISEKDVRDFVDAYRGEEIILVVRRSKETREVALTPRASFPPGEGPIGIAMARLVIRRVPWYRAPWDGALAVAESTRAIVFGFGSVIRDLATHGKTAMAISGPVGIFFFAHDTFGLGAAYIMQFAAMLSINLAILNFLPIPALDGGRVLFLLIEKAKGRKINPRVENIIHGIGFALLLFLMVLVTYRDIVKIF